MIKKLCRILSKKDIREIARDSENIIEKEGILIFTGKISCDFKKTIHKDRLTRLRKLSS